MEWFIKTVYQPHYDHFQQDFGKTIVGYFYIRLRQSDGHAAWLSPFYISTP